MNDHAVVEINQGVGQAAGEAPYIAQMPEHPPAGTHWGSERYKVDGYSVGQMVHHRRNFSYIAEPIGWYPEYETAVSAAQQAGDGFAVGMSVSIVDI